MHYVTLVHGEEQQVEVTEVGGDRFVVLIDGRKIEVDAPATAENSLSMLRGEDAYPVEIERFADGVDNVLVRGQAVHVEVLDLRQLRLRKAHEAVTAVAGGPATIVAPMPGKVVAVLVTAGQTVNEGQGLVVVEAMKMENELRSPRAGVVTQLAAREGAAVDGGALLCVIE